MGAPPHQVLVVEDDQDAAEAFRLLFEFWGYEVEVGLDGGAALSIATSSVPHAVVLDLGMPTVDAGCTLVQQMRRLPGGDTILIIAVTGHTKDLDRRRAIAAGCDFFFLKPAEPEALREALSTIQAHRQWAIRARRR
jgi:CheY-like chemotaxis protein